MEEKGKREMERTRWRVKESSRERDGWIKEEMKRREEVMGSL